MKKSEINAIFRQYVKDRLSPTPDERDFVSKLYESFKEILGEGNCIQIGSYPRFTAITPLHDLDILYIVGKYSGSVPDPTVILNELKGRIQTSYKNPTKYSMRIESQTHSTTVIFSQAKDDVFSVDIVPAYTNGTNEFGEDKYIVPEIMEVGHNNRNNIYTEAAKEHRSLSWIPSDPRGYIKVAEKVNGQNNDFRKSVKFIKAWRSSCKKDNEDFKLKSFHIEQVITKYFRTNPAIEIFDAVFQFFYDLPTIIDMAQIPDRADPQKNIDEYVDQLTPEQRQMITKARDAFLIKLEDLTDASGVDDLLSADYYTRTSSTEEYLFDQRIPVLLEDGEDLTITATALYRKGDFRERILDAIGLIEVDRKIKFESDGSHRVDLYKWKVRNDNNSEEPRGEITDHHTLSDPEYTKYKGRHFVECYGIRNGICVTRSKQNVVLKAWYLS